MPQAIYGAIVIYKMKRKLVIRANKTSVKVALKFISRVTIKTFFDSWDGVAINSRSSG
jgi:hypothetical protein